MYGNIIEFNSRILAGYLNEWGAKATRGLPVVDDQDELKRAVKTAAEDNDMVILNAGASAGTKDFSARVLAEIGCTSGGDPPRSVPGTARLLYS